jgi:carbonic anhydrase
LALAGDPALASDSKAAKPSPDEAIAMLKAGNERFVTRKTIDAPAINHDEI